MTDTNKTLIARLRTLDTCAVSDALDRLQLSGTVIALRPVSTTHRIAGEIVTVRLGPAQADLPTRHLCTAAIDAAGADNVIVVENRVRPDAAGWGGLLSTAASVRKIAGTIVDGPVRDVDDSRNLDYPVFARSVVPFTARGRVAEHAWNEPITIDNIQVEPGDLVIADGSGVVFISSDRIELVLETAEEIAAREARLTAAVRSGTSVSEVMGANYEAMLERDKSSKE
ncbi:uncharacterized protein METZ01_LOCUS45001 [marine metagenome]|jgi:regulator of RNase E activity RraA|uniref:Dimethylmenaquinone methyltransferase n=1 Tax=marine metagenome TaxID=408172 RepID=A0A381RQI6_9ZZZZ|tara:strand:+ start:839 stop:1519 length:681 start_codon:yes stop_codon:yes gene_type:complete